MLNNHQPKEFDPVVPEEYYIRETKKLHFAKNMAAWKAQGEEKMKEQTATDRRNLLKYFAPKWIFKSFYFL